jgi:hypothetical protein
MGGARTRGRGVPHTDDRTSAAKTTEAPPPAGPAPEVERRPAADARPALIRIAKPLAKGAIKGGLLLYDKGKAAAADLRAKLDGLVTEARSELREQGKTPPREPAERRPPGSPRE